MRLPASLLMLVVSCGVTLADAPRRVVSFNLCADQLVLALADPEQIAGLSPYAADASVSVMTEKAGAYPRLSWQAESTIALGPDLVLIGDSDRPVTKHILRAQGLRLHEITLIADLDTARRQVTEVAAVLGHPERGQKLIAEIETARARLHAAPKPHVERVYARRPASPTPPESPAQPRSESDDVVFVSRARPQIEPPVEANIPAPQPRVDVPDENEEVHALRVSDGLDSEEIFIVGPAGLKIGRTAPADAIIAHPSVSRQHCVIGLANDELLVTDLSSTNGTFIDDERIERAAVLPVGSILRAGQVSLTHVAGTREEVLRPKSGPGANRRGRMRPAHLAIAP